jgi:predicted metal-dependent HD superfamily phosphohydrolase
MKTWNQQVVIDVKKHIIQTFQKYPRKDLKYHSFEHTQNVASRCQKAANELKLNIEDSTTLQVAAWFHDVGYLFTLDHHEAKSIELVKDYFSVSNDEPHYTDSVVECIASTEIGVVPTSKLPALLKDIDISYGLSTNFLEKGNLLREEWELTKQLTFSNMDWRTIQLNFLKNLRWYTAYAQQRYQKIIEEWIYKLR